MKFLKPAHNQRGAALLMVMFIFILLSSIIMEITYDTTVEYQISAQSVNEIKAYYAARSGVELSLLRLAIYKKALQQYGSVLKDQKNLLDLIWQFPFSWPPLLPEDLGAVSKDQIEKTVKASKMDASYAAIIESESGKIDINDLASPSETLAKATKTLLLQVFESKMADETWARAHIDVDFNALVNNMIDWIDEDTESLNGGSEQSYYPDLRQERIPPNQAFKTIDELHMVAGMTDAIFEVLVSRVTVFGTKSVNVNYAPQEVLAALHSSIRGEILDNIMKRRTDPTLGGPFKDADDFFKHLDSLGVPSKSIQESNIPITTDIEYNFRITSTGQFGKSAREIIAIVYDFDRVKSMLGEALEKDDKNKSGASGGSGSGTQSTPQTQPPAQTPPPTPASPPSKATKPRVVYWKER